MRTAKNVNIQKGFLYKLKERGSSVIFLNDFKLAKPVQTIFQPFPLTSFRPVLRPPSSMH